MVQAHVLAFLSSLQVSREARVREKQNKKKMTEMLYSEKIRKVHWFIGFGSSTTSHLCLRGSRDTAKVNPGGDCKLDSNHWTVDCTVVMGLELR